MNNSNGCAWFPPSRACEYCKEGVGDDNGKSWRNKKIHDICFRMKVNSMTFLKNINLKYFE